jgi:predicted nucleic acid-binding protein
MDKSTIIFDTTYILPLFGFTIDLPQDSIIGIKSLWINGLIGFNLIIPSISLIEIMYKFNAIYRNGQQSSIFDYYNNSLPTLLKLPNVKIFYSETSIIVSEMVSKIRIMGHNDIMDCYIAATAYANDGIYLTEETTIQKVLKKIPEYNVDRIMNWKSFSNDFL